MKKLLPNVVLAYSGLAIALGMNGNFAPKTTGN